MVNSILAAIVNLLLVFALALPAAAQTEVEREKRLAELERKIKLLDSAFASSGTGDFDQRLLAAERKIDELLGKPPATTLAGTTPAVLEAGPPAEAASSPLQSVSIKGDLSNL